jgi:hypothetical protein
VLAVEDFVPDMFVFFLVFKEVLRKEKTQVFPSLTRKVQPPLLVSFLRFSE